MDRFTYYLGDKPIIGALCIMGLMIFGVLGMVSLAQSGKAAFLEKSERRLLAAGLRKSSDSSVSSSSSRATQVTIGGIANTQEEQDNSSSNNNTEPLIIYAVAMVNPTVSCSGSSTVVKIDGLRIASNDNHKSASYRWKVDVLSTIDYSTRDQWRGTIPAGETDYVISYAGTDASALYSRVFTHPHDEIRLRARITSPNDVASQWLTIPASEDCR